MIHFEQLQGDLQEVILKAKMTSKGDLKVWLFTEVVQLAASMSSCFVTFVLVRQETSTDEGGGEMGIGSKDVKVNDET